MTALPCQWCHHVHSDRFPWCDNLIGGTACHCSRMQTTDPVTALPPFIAAAQARCDAATDGWFAAGIDVLRPRPGAWSGQDDVPTTEADAEFIAAARTDLPVALAALATVWDEATVEAVAEALFDEPANDDEYATVYVSRSFAPALAAAVLAVVRARIEAELEES